jgi:transglutaminase-like putative cysteine protease
MRGKIFIFVIICLLLLSFWPYFPAIYMQKPSEHDPFDKVPEETVVPGIDSDGDLLKDIDEKQMGTNPLAPDSDGDGLKDGDEYRYWLNRYNKEVEDFPLGILKWLKDRHPEKTDSEILELYQPNGDLDKDGIINILDVDSDSDGLGDGFELQISTDPANPDTDGDGIIDRDDPNPTENRINPDTQLPEDWPTVYNITDPFGDPDGDGKTNLEEYRDGTSPVYPGEGLDTLQQDSLDINNYFDANFSKIVFIVEPKTDPLYWRLTAFDNYNNNRWTQLDLSNRTYEGELSTDVTVYKSASTRTYNITFWGAFHGYMPTALNTVALYDIKLDQKMYVSSTYVPEVYVDSYGGFSVREYVRQYTFTTKVYDYDKDMLTQALAVSGPSVQNYLNIPISVSDRVRTMAADLTRHLDSPFDKALELTEHLRKTYEYTLNPPLPEKAETEMVDYFLFDSRQGKCTEFATAFVILARILDIPARLVTGYAIGDIETYTDGQEVKNRRVVREGHKHAWPEILLDGVGWIPFEVTAPYSNLDESTGYNTTGKDPTVWTDKGQGGEGTEYNSSADDTRPEADPDGDGLTNEEEEIYGTNPLNPDSDKDSLGDGMEVYTTKTDPTEPDSDADGLTDSFEWHFHYNHSIVDWDNDGVPNYRTDPNNPDTDKGGMLDGAEKWNLLEPLDPNDDTMHDSDGDGLSNELEDALGTDSMNNDTDDDGLKDGIEFYTFHTDPLNNDTDDDGLLDGEEVDPRFGYNTNPTKNDTDNDGLLDGDEVKIYQTDPNNPDTDTDGLSDSLELDNSDGFTTDPLNPDTDSDGIPDGTEDRNRDGAVAKGEWNDDDGPGETDPNKKDTDGGGLPDLSEIGIKNDPLDPTDDVTTGDFDGDGLSDLQEFIHGTNLTDDDSDDDGLFDGEEVLVIFTDPLNPDTDGDGISDGEEIHKGSDGYYTNPLKPDTDNDGLEDGVEIDTVGTDPTNPDTDDDGLEDGFEYNNDFNLTQDGIQRLDPLNRDTDGGGVKDGTEYYNSLDPLDPTDDITLRDTDDDGLTDEDEIELGTDLNNPDSDKDGLLDGKEVHGFKTDPLRPDTDDDGLLDGEETVSGNDGYITEPTNNDTDGDGLNDSYESLILHTDPTKKDTDNDNLNDNIEIDDSDGLKTSPTSWDSDGDGLPDGWQDLNQNSIKDLGEYEDRNLNGKLESGSWNGGAGPGETDPTVQDTDGGGALDSDEVTAKTPHNPLDASDDDDIIDTDRDGLTDLEEDDVYGTDKNRSDTDNDGIGDFEEVFAGKDGYITDPLRPDTDNDTIFDGEEVIAGFDGYITSPITNDTDNDTLTDQDEIYFYKTDPTKKDTDGDGTPDNMEVKLGGGRSSNRASARGTDPNDPDSDDDGLPDGFIDGWGYDTESGLWGLFGKGNQSKDGNMTIGVVEGTFIYAEGENRNLDWKVDTGPWNNGSGPGETNPTKADTDEGGALDGIEIIYTVINKPTKFNPLNPADDGNLIDTDKDGLTDIFEKSAASKTLWNDPDSDNDGLWDGFNVDLNFDGTIDRLGELVGHNNFPPTEPNDKDTDDDSQIDGDEVLIYFTNPLSVDTDHDGLWDGHDIDVNLDGIIDPRIDHLGELDGHNGYLPTKPLNPDSDNDTLWDGENIYYLGSHNGEISFGTNPNNPDTDGDELNDPEEIKRGTNATKWDTDEGGVGDGIEVFRIPQTDPLDPDDDIPRDTDKDGLFNHYENNTYYDLSAVDYTGDLILDHYTHWLLNDTDQDDLLDGEEVYNYGTEPLLPDTDADGIKDGMEVNLGDDPNGYITNPLEDDSDNDTLPDGWIDINKNSIRDLGEYEDRNLDGIVDTGEWNNGEGPGETDPSKWDTDSGGSSDFEEIMLGLDPLDPSDDVNSKVYVETKLGLIEFPSTVNKTINFVVKGAVMEVLENRRVPGVPVEVYIGFKDTKYLAGTGETDLDGWFALTCVVPAPLNVSTWPLYIQTRAIELSNTVYNGTQNAQDYIITVTSHTNIYINSYNSPLTIGSVLTIEGKLFDATNVTIPDQPLKFHVKTQTDKILFLGTTITNQYGSFIYLFETSEELGFELGQHLLYITFDGTSLLMGTNKSAVLEILADVTDITITSVEPTEQVAGRWIWVNGTIDTTSGPLPTGNLDLNIVGISSQLKFTDLIELNGTNKFSKPILLSSDLASGQYRLFARYSLIETSNAVTILVIGFTDFTMDTIEVHRGDPPVTITGALIDNTRKGLSDKPITVEFEKQIKSLITDAEGKFSFEFEAVKSHPLGTVPITLSFIGDDRGSTQYLGVETVRNIVVNSPTYIKIEQYPNNINRSDEFIVKGTIRDDQGEGVANAKMYVYISYTYLHEFITNEKGEFTFKKLIPRTIAIGLRIMELDFIGDSKYENSSASEMIGIYDEPWLNTRMVTKLNQGEPFRLVVLIREPNGIEPLINELIDVEVDGERQTLMTNDTGEAEFSSVFPSDKSEVTVHVSYKGDLSQYLLPGESTFIISLKRSQTTTNALQNISSNWHLILGLVLIVIVAYSYVRWRKRHIMEIQDIITEMEEELETTDEIRKVIYKAYKRFLTVLQQYGFLRKKSDTPREFARAVRKALPDIDRKHLHKLTSLFEEARYSDHDLTTHERFKALRSLKMVKNSIEQLPPPRPSINIKELIKSRNQPEA